MTDPRPDWRGRGIAMGALLVVAGVAAWLAGALTISTEITHFLPANEDRELAEIAAQMSGSDLNRSVTLLVEANEESVAIAAARDIAEALEASGEVSWVRRGPDEDLSETFYSLYFERRYLYFTDAPEAAPLDDEALRGRAEDLRQRLVSPTGAFIRRVAPADPLLGFVRHLEHLRETQQGSMRVAGDQLVTEGGAAVVFFASVCSPFDVESSTRLEAAVDAALAQARATHGSSVLIRQSGVHRFALSSQAAIEADVTRISVVSSVGVLLLFLLLFRSPRYLLLSALPLLSGLVAGLAATQLIFGRIHGLSLAFGATLIGVAIDYVAHAINHHLLAPAAGGPSASLRGIWPGLALGCATTVAGLVGLAWTSFPGIRELAVLTSVGVIVALFATRYMLPPFLPHHPRPHRWHVRLSNGLGSLLMRLGESRKALLVLPALALVVCGAGLGQLRWVDDVRVLNTLDPTLLAEDEAVRAAVSRMDGGRFVIAWGPDDETALQRNDVVYARLMEAEAAGEVERVRSLHPLLWSADTQERSRAALRESPQLERRLAEALTAEGLVAEGFAAFAESLREDASEPLTWQELADSPAGVLVRSFRLELDEGRVAFVTLTRGADLDALEARLEGLEGVRIFDQQRFLQQAYGGFRARTLEMIGMGLAGVFLLVLVRYRRFGPALAAFLPAVLAAATSLGALVLLGYEANLMHLVALLLVLSMGVDYGIFMVESRDREEGPAPTVVSLLLACASTVLSFGLLAMSANPALRALGLVTGIGVLLSLLLAPMAWLFIREEP